MRSARVNTNGAAAKGLAELNHHIQHGQEKVRNGVSGDGQGLSEEDESRTNEYADGANGARKELVQPQAAQQREQQQPPGPQGPVVLWERFLPLRSLMVLLVENDDSTRHVVSALLRNCSYDVTAVANGVEAWKILEDLTNHIDLVLTEVAMPRLSGLGFLGKIMSHKTCQNIPVIMMSSNDSMGLVFKCLSKGAVDFLVKPIRKNELKNLWQHVWRKCHSYGGSGSESGIRAQKSAKSKSVEGCDNNTGSNDEDNNASISLSVRDGSDYGSGTQNYWTKEGVEFDSHLFAKPPDINYAQMIHEGPRALGNSWVTKAATRECHGLDDEHGSVAMSKDLEIRVHGNPAVQLEDPSNKVSTALGGTCKEKNPNFESKKDDEKLEKDKLDLNRETQNGELRKTPIRLICSTTHYTNPQMDILSIGTPNDISMTITQDKATHDTKEVPLLDRSFKRQRDAEEIGTSAKERNFWTHSDLSAFSRYNTTPTANQAPTGNMGSCSPRKKGLEAAKTEPMHNLQSNLHGIPSQWSNGSSNNNDMGSTTNNSFTKPTAPVPKSTVNIHPSSTSQPDKNYHVSSLHSLVPGKDKDMTLNTVMEHSPGMHQQLQVQHHHHHYHHHHHHVHNMKQQKQPPDDDDVSNGPSDFSSMPFEGNAANYSSNGSASGSNNGSNGQKGCSGQDGSSTLVIAEGSNIARDKGVAEMYGAGGGGGSRSGVEQNRFPQREAALNKFRQKRKERCFEKKVRYQSRQRLAEQRPRVRGQFVRQSVHMNESKDKDC